MLNGVPCVASNLPGVRQPVKRHGMGAIAEIGSSDSLAAAVMQVLEERRNSSPDLGKIRAEYDPDRVAAFYEDLFIEISQEISGNDKQ
jgi:glycosyltransferase involved in cell wall biosynthesis